MKMLGIVLLVSLVAAQTPRGGRPGPPPRLPMTTCPDDDPCSDATRPWMRGTVEKWCGRDDAALAKIQKEFPGVTVNKCECVNMCDTKAPHADETGGRVFDTRCAVRCSPAHCTCPNRCDS